MERKKRLLHVVQFNANTPDEAGTAFETAKTWRTAKKREQKEDASSIRTSPHQRTKEQKQLIYGTSEDSDSEEKGTPTRTPTKKATSSLRTRSRRSPMKARTKMKQRPKSRPSPQKKKTLQKKQSMKKTEAEEDNGSGSSPSSEDEETAAIAKPKHLLKPPKFDVVKPFETFWAQFKNCAEYNQ